MIIDNTLKGKNQSLYISETSQSYSSLPARRYENGLTNKKNSQF